MRPPYGLSSRDLCPADHHLPEGTIQHWRDGIMISIIQNSNYSCLRKSAGIKLADLLINNVHDQILTEVRN